MQYPVVMFQALDQRHAGTARQRLLVILLELGGGFRGKDFVVGLAIQFRP